MLRSSFAEARTSSPYMHFLESLNPEQREAVLHLDGPLLILAGADRGRRASSPAASRTWSATATPSRTRCWRSRSRTRPRKKMRARVESLLGSDVTGMWVSTFHALCARLLRREAPAIGLSRDFVIYDSSDQLTVVKQALKALQIRRCVRAAAGGALAHQPCEEQDGEPRGDGLGRGLESPRPSHIAKIYTYYLNALKESSALDFDDLLLKTVDLFEQSERVRTKYSEQFRYVMVDEYQDTNRPQVPPDSPPRRERTSQPLRRRRPGSVDLQVARRRSAQHPRLRAGLRRSHHRQARTQLPIDADHPRRRVGRHQPEPQPQGQAPLDRSQRRRSHHLLPRRRRARGGRLHHAHRADGARRRRRSDGGGAVPHQRAVARD